MSWSRYACAVPCVYGLNDVEIHQSPKVGGLVLNISEHDRSIVDPLVLK